MTENELWQRFYESGKVEYYLEYRNYVNSTHKNTELESNAENNGTGHSNKGTEYR